MEQHCLRQRSVRLLLAFLLWSPAALAQATIVQISDTHIGLSTAPNALQHLQTVVNQINAMSPQPDAVIVSGDIGETTSAWTTAKNTLANLKAAVYFCPGNHDIHTTNISAYRQYFGNDYYSFKINNIIEMLKSKYSSWINRLPSGLYCTCRSKQQSLCRPVASFNPMSTQRKKDRGSSDCYSVQENRYHRNRRSGFTKMLLMPCGEDLTTSSLQMLHDSSLRLLHRSTMCAFDSATCY